MSPTKLIIVRNYTFGMNPTSSKETVCKDLEQAINSDEIMLSHFAAYS